MKVINPKYFFVQVMAMLVSSFSAYALPVQELEPNETNATTMPLSTGQYAQGSIPTAVDYDGFIIQNVNTDQFICAFLNAIETPGGGDPVLSLFYNSNINDTINADLFNDDGGPPAVAFDDSLICGEPIRRAGSLFVRAEGFGSSTIQTYHFYQAVISPNEILPEVEPNDSAQSAMPINSPAIAANLSADADFYSFHAEVGERIVVMVDGDPGRPNPGTPVDPIIRIFDSDGVTDISESVPGEQLVDPEPGPTNARAYGALPAPHTGTFFVRINKGNGDDGDYRLIVLVDGATPQVGACLTLTACTLRSAENCRGKFGGVGTNCNGDDDVDGLPNAVDNCSAVANALQEDLDGDTVGDVCDTCATDRLKVQPGSCGCGNSDTDSDNDGAANCNDQCPNNGNETVPGACGCGILETDGNGNGVFDCQFGGDIKATLGTLASKLNALKGAKKPSKSKAQGVKSLLTNIQAVVQSNGGQIATNGLNLSQQIGALAKAVNKTLNSSGPALAKNKKAAAKLAQKIAAAIV